MIVAAAVAILVAALGALWLRRKSTEGQFLVELPHSVPWLGWAGTFFKNPNALLLQWRHKYGGRAVRFHNLGGSWTVLYQPDDISAVMSAKTDVVSFNEGFERVIKGFFPPQFVWKDDLISFARIRAFSDSLAGPKFDLALGAFRTELEKTEFGGKRDLFKTILELLYKGQAAAVVGNAVTEPSRWPLFRELYGKCDPEQAFVNPADGLELMILGSRKAFDRLVDLMIEANKSSSNQGECIFGNIREYYRKHGFNSGHSVEVETAHSSWALLMASVVNTHAFLSWIIFHLYTDCKKEVRERILAEVRSADDLNIREAPHLQRALDEIMRLYSPGLSYRLTKKKLNLPSGLTLEPGQLLLWSHPIQYRTGPDASMSEPLTMNLSRPKSKDVYTFGGGRHPCLGERLARTEILLALRHLDMNYEIEVLTKAAEVSETQINNGAQPLHPIYVNLTRK